MQCLVIFTVSHCDSLNSGVASSTAERGREGVRGRDWTPSPRPGTVVRLTAPFGGGGRGALCPWAKHLPPAAAEERPPAPTALQAEGRGAELSCKAPSRRSPQDKHH